MNDRELLERFVRERDDDAFRMLTDQYYDQVYAVCLRELGVAASAEDATQVVFVLFARSADSIRNTEAISGWLFRTAITVTLNMKRAASRRRDRETKGAEMLDMIQRSRCPEEKNTEACVRLNRALKSLGEKYRSAIIAYYMEEKSRNQIAEELGCTYDTVQKRIKRGLKKLQEALGEQD